MGDRFSKIVVGALLVVLAVYLAQPYVDRLLFSPSTPREVEPRGTLAEIERTSIEIFEHASPSVVQVVGRADGLEALPSEGENVPGAIGDGIRVGRGRPHRHQRSRGRGDQQSRRSPRLRPGVAGQNRRDRAQLRPRGGSRGQYARIAAADRDRHVQIGRAHV